MRAVFGAFLFVIIVLPCTLAALYTTSVMTWVLDRTFYKDLLDSEPIYDAFLAEMPNFVYEDGISRGTQEQANTALALALREVVTPAYLREQMSNAVDDFFTLLDDPTFTTQIEIETGPVKDALGGEGGEAFARVYAANLLPCTPGEEPRSEDFPLIRCLSSETSVEDAEQLVLEDLPAFREGIPNPLVVSENVTADVQNNNTSIRSVIIGVVIALTVTAGILWLMTGFVAGNTRRRIMMWLGVMLLLPALLVLGTGVSVANGAADATVRGIQTDEILINNEPVSDEFRDVLAETAVSALERVANGFYLVGGIATATGIMLLVVAFSQPAGSSGERKRNRTVTIPA
ncbi:MAG: hypothetical protein OHK0046_46780 [Anaerolineae bacterium]